MNATAEPKRLEKCPTPPPSPHSNGWLLLLLLLGMATAMVMEAYKNTSFIVEDEAGNLQLSEKRQKKLKQKLKELEEAEQYVLRAERAGYYPCHACPDSKTIYLLPSEVWKYGITTKGQFVRYRGRFLRQHGLKYVVQFYGTLQECLEEEQRKIYNYALLPENLKRKTPLIRPPGNKVDH